MGFGEASSALSTPSAVDSRAPVNPSEVATMRDPVQIVLALDLASDNPSRSMRSTGCCLASVSNVSRSR